MIYLKLETPTCKSLKLYEVAIGRKPTQSLCWMMLVGFPAGIEGAKSPPTDGSWCWKLDVLGHSIPRWGGWEILTQSCLDLEWGLRGLHFENNVDSPVHNLKMIGGTLKLGQGLSCWENWKTGTLTHSLYISTFHMSVPKCSTVIKSSPHSDRPPWLGRKETYDWRQKPGMWCWGLTSKYSGMVPLWSHLWRLVNLPPA